MPSFSTTNRAHREAAECVRLFLRLANIGAIRVGQIYPWPLQFKEGFDNADLNTILTDYFAAIGRTYSISGDQLTVT